jgi:hypothetical protein
MLISSVKTSDGIGNEIDLNIIREAKPVSIANIAPSKLGLFE